MTGRNRGLFRLWIVAATIAVFALVATDWEQKVSFWNDMSTWQVKICVQAQMTVQNHPDSIECERKLGLYKSIFERENTTPLVYWSQVFEDSVLMVVGGSLFIVATAWLLIAIGRWIYRGFTPPPAT
jgi:hypothetical protein